MSGWTRNEWGDYALRNRDGRLVVQVGPVAARELVTLWMQHRLPQLPWWRRIAARVAFGREFA